MSRENICAPHQAMHASCTRDVERYGVLWLNPRFYAKVDDTIASEIAARELRPGDRLPSEDELLIAGGRLCGW